MSRSTKEKLIEAALDAFGEHGYDGAGLREICKKAGVNNAAVNYHFGDKRGLYRAVLESLLEQSKCFPSPKLDGPPEERLRQLIRLNLVDIFKDRGQSHEKLIFREIAEPSEELREVVREPIRQNFEMFSAVVRALAPGQLSQEKVNLMVMSIFGQIDYYRMFYRFIPEVIGEQSAEELTLDTLTDHIAEFSIKAISSGLSHKDFGPTPPQRRP